MAMQLPGTYSNKATEGEGEDGKQGKRGKKGLKAKQQPDEEEEDNEDDGSEKREFAPSRLIVEFAVSNHNVLKQQRDKKHKEKAVKELSITQKSQGEGEEEGEKKKKGGKKTEKREFFDITSKEKNHAKMRFGRKRTGKIRGDYDKERKKSNTSNKHMGKRLRTRI